MNYTGRVLQIGFGPYSDSITGKSYPFIKVDIHKPPKESGADWENVKFRVFMDKPVPKKEGDLVDLELKGTVLGVPDQINYIQTSKDGQKVIPARNFEILTD